MDTTNKQKPTEATFYFSCEVKLKKKEEESANIEI